MSALTYDQAQLLVASVYRAKLSMSAIFSFVILNTTDNWQWRTL